jgi:type I restriction enzyme S subunit
MIPETWSVRRGKTILKLLNRPIRDDDEIITCFRDGEVTLRKNRREDGFTIALQETGYQGIEPGDLVVHGMDGFAGSIGISDSRGKATPVLNVMDSTQNKRYLMYYLRALAYKDVFMSLSTGIRVRSCDLRWNKLAVLPFLIPPIAEQNAIVSFLDDQVSQIDSLIQEAKASIEEYKQWKASTIFEAVTKGLIQDAEMKYSGIEWIGDIPKTSRLIRLRYLVQDYKAGPFGSSLITDKLLHEGDILVYTPEHVASKNTTSEKNLYLPKERAKEMEQFFVYAGDIVFPIVGSLGRAMMITEEVPCGIINQRLAKFSLRENAVDPDYFMWVFGRSSFFTPYIEVNCRGSFIVNLTKTIVYDMPFVLPMEKAEQRRIAKYLDKKCGTIDAMIAEKESVILDLESFKRSLIYEIVTGKRKVV